MTSNGSRASRRQVLIGAGALGVAAALTPASVRALANGRPYALADFFTPELTHSVRLSPSGDRIAVLEQIGTADDPRGAIDLIDAADPEGPRRRIDLGALRVQAVDWASDRRLLVRVIIETRSRARQVIGSNIPIARQTLRSRRTLSIDADDPSQVVALFQDQRRLMRQNFDLGRLVDMLSEDPDHVMMTAYGDDGLLGLNRVNVVTGSATRVERGNTGTIGWYVQNGVAVVRRDINPRGTLETLYARTPGQSEWRMTRRNRMLDAPDFQWVGPSEKPGIVLVAVRLEGEDYMAVRELDLASLALGPPMNARDGRDVHYGLTDAYGRYLGAAYYGERLEYEFADPALVSIHRGLDRFFEGDCDVHLRDVSNDRSRFIVRAEGPKEPGAWYFYDRRARAVVNIGARRLLDYDRLGNCERLDVQTRDGAAIEAYLTAPPTGRPGPLVVLPHGGPEARDHRTWDRQAQVLAAQGWWVLQPNFRGSDGYGLGFAREGWRRWGDRMQEDVEDAVAHVVASKGLDQARVAIMGTSYGGYAALMGAVLRPDLYKAAIAICGVFDLPDMMDWQRRMDDAPDQPIYDFWTKRIGDPRTDSERMASASPRRRADEIACPVLLVHGVEDDIVPVAQSRRMRDALRAARKTVDYIEIEAFGHADWEDEQEKALMQRYVALLSDAFA